MQNQARWASRKKKKKRFHHFESVTEQKWKESLKKSPSLLPGRTEIERYFTTIESATDRVDPLEYWIELQFFWVKWQLIWWLFQCHLLPLSVFADETCIGRWNRLADENFEREVMLKQNKHYLQTVSVVSQICGPKMALLCTMCVVFLFVLDLWSWNSLYFHKTINIL